MTVTVENTRDLGRARGCSWWVRRLLGGAFVLGLVLLLTGALYQSIASASDRRRFPPPGELVGIGGRRLHLYCQGSGGPVVILEAGLPNNWLQWSLVQPELAAFSRVCAYDRAGLGWSEPAPSPQQSTEVAESLHALLSRANVPAPYVLVGHSMGGLYVRTFARMYSDETAGVVLLDSSHENQNLRLPPLLTQRNDTIARFLCRFVTPFGVIRLLGIQALAAESTPLSREQQQELAATMNQTHFCQANLDELEAAAIDMSQADRPASLGDIPLVVLTAGVGLSQEDAGVLPPGVTSAVLELRDDIWMELQLELVELSSQGRQVIARDSGHDIQYDQPELVVNTVRQVVESVR